MLERRNEILLICSEFPPGPGGIGNHACNLSRYLCKQNKINVLTVSDYVDEVEAITFDSNEKYNIHRFRRSSIPLLTYIIRIYELIRVLNKNKYSHCILSGRFSLWMSLIIKLLYTKTKLVAVLHGSEIRPKNYLYGVLLRLCLNYFDVIISVSQFSKGLLPLKFQYMTNCLVIPNGINPDYLLNHNNKLDHIDLVGSPIFLSVGSITKRKGQKNFIKILPSLIDKYPQAQYHCIGLAIEKEELMQSIKKYKVQDHVTIHGFIPNNQLGKFYSQADIMIMLSNSDIDGDVEGFGIAVIEANLFGVPTIGTKLSGLSDAIQENITGILVNPKSKQEIMQGVNYIYNNKEELSKNAIQWANKHSWDNIGLQYQKAINNA